MQPKNLSEVRELVAAKLPARYEPPLLTFYGSGVRQAGDNVIIGDDYATELHCTQGGAVVSIDPQGKLPTRFMNSSIEKLAEFLQVVAGTDRSDDDQEREMWHKLTALDPPAFSDEEHWWSVVREQASL